MSLRSLTGKEVRVIRVITQMTQVSRGADMAVNNEIFARKIITLRRDLLPDIEEWRAKQRPIPNETEAIRRLVEIGLKAQAPDNAAA